jgi:hypothetical protein
MNWILRPGRGLAGAAVLMLTACGTPEVDRSPITIQLVGDSVYQMVDHGTNAGGMVECSLPFRAEVDGPEGAHAVMRGGRVQYWWWTTGGEAGSHEFDQVQVTRLWVDSVFPVGQPRQSHPHGFGQGSPAQPVRGEVVFDYGASNTDETRQTEPFRFYCY